MRRLSPQCKAKTECERFLRITAQKLNAEDPVRTQDLPPFERQGWGTRWVYIRVILGGGFLTVNPT